MVLTTCALDIQVPHFERNSSALGDKAGRISNGIVSGAKLFNAHGKSIGPKIAAMADKWIHLCETGGDPWVLPIWTSLNKAKQTGKALKITPELSEMAVHISTRLTMLPWVMNRLNRDLAALYEAAREYKPEHVFSKAKEEVCLRVNDDIKYCVIADVDSFLFEVNACADLMQKFFGLLYALVGDAIPENELIERLKAALKNDNVSEGWFKKLDKLRNFAAHNGTPYVAIDISQSSRPEAVFLMENLKFLHNPDKFFSTSDLQEIADGFGKAKVALQRHLIKLFGPKLGLSGC